MSKRKLNRREVLQRHGGRRQRGDGVVCLARLESDVECGGRQFADSLSSELITPTGDPSSGYVATFQVGVAV
jgi:hypothetical protein